MKAKPIPFDYVSSHFLATNTFLLQNKRIFTKMVGKNKSQLISGHTSAVIFQCMQTE